MQLNTAGNWKPNPKKFGVGSEIFLVYGTFGSINREKCLRELGQLC